MRFRNLCTKGWLALMPALLAAAVTRAQLPNRSFEQLDSTGRIVNWGGEASQLQSLDSGGHAVSDSIVIDKSYCAASPDAHSGGRALELRNAYNVSQGLTIPGTADLVRAGYVYSEMLQRAVAVTSAPAVFSFYYKFLPAGNDTAWALLTAYDSTLTETGRAEVELVGAAGSYTFISAPVVYSGAPNASYVSVRFSTARPGGAASYGTRFLIDDVNTAALGLAQPAAEVLTCYPTVAAGELKVVLPPSCQTESCRWSVVDAAGKTAAAGEVPAFLKQPLPIPVAALPAGSYVLVLTTGSGRSLTARFVRP